MPIGIMEWPRATLVATPAANDQESDLGASAAAPPARDGNKYIASTAVTKAAAMAEI